MQLDEIDIKVLRENYDNEIIEQLDLDNVSRIYSYLVNSGVYYAKDLFIGQVDLFLMEYDLFVEKFEKLKRELGDNYVELLAEDTSLIDIMYN